MGAAESRQAPGRKGLKTGALSLVSGVVIGVAATAPAYSLAAVLGFVAAAVGPQAPAVMILAFVPMLAIATAYHWLNRLEPDCGTTFAWATRAMGPWAGWMGGWGILATGILVLANLAQVAGKYTFLLMGWESAAGDTAAVTIAGVLWIALMTWICFLGIEVSARTQRFLLAAEVATLAVFAAAALFKVYLSPPPGALEPSLAWLEPWKIRSASALASGVLLAIFVYWGWDSAVSVNEESRDPGRGPGRAALASTVCLLAIYVVVSVAAQAYHGPEFLARNSGDVLSALGRDVLGSPLDKLLVVAVLTSAAASTQTTILPTTRTALSMAAHGALPERFGHVHPRRLTPDRSTAWTGGLAILWYVGLTLVSENILFDGILSLGLMIAFYYGLTGYACPITYRRVLFKSVKNLVVLGVVPGLGALVLTWAFVQSCLDLADPANSTSGDSWLGLGPPFVIGAGFLLLGALLMVLRWRAAPGFFRRRVA